MDNTRGLLDIKIETAREKLSEDTKMAIDAVGWKMIIAEMRQTKGFSFEQLGELETETELLLCGLITSEEYPKNLAERMKIPKAEVDALMNDLNQLIFSRIKEEFIKRIERKNNQKTVTATPAGIKIIKPENKIGDKKLEEMPAGEQKIKIKTILAEKLTSSTQTQSVQTDHSLKNIPGTNSSLSQKSSDPYREIPE